MRADVFFLLEIRKKIVLDKLSRPQCNVTAEMVLFLCIRVGNHHESFPNSRSVQSSELLRFIRMIFFIDGWVFMSIKFTINQ